MPDWFDGGGQGKVVDVTALLDSKAQEVMWQIVQHGALVSIGTTSDGGALAVTVTMDGRYQRSYFREVDELLGWLEEASEAVVLVATNSPASTVPRRRSRRSVAP